MAIILWIAQFGPWSAIPFIAIQWGISFRREKNPKIVAHAQKALEGNLFFFIFGPVYI